MKIREVAHCPLGDSISSIYSDKKEDNLLRIFIRDSKSLVCFVCSYVQYVPECENFFLTLCVGKEYRKNLNGKNLGFAFSRGKLTL